MSTDAPLSLSWLAGTASNKLKAFEKPLDLLKRTPKEGVEECLRVKIMEPHPLDASMAALYGELSLNDASTAAVGM